MNYSEWKAIPSERLSKMDGHPNAQLKRPRFWATSGYVYDVISAMTGLYRNNAGRSFRDLVARFTEVQCVVLNFKFR